MAGRLEVEERLIRDDELGAAAGHAQPPARVAAVEVTGAGDEVEFFDEGAFAPFWDSIEAATNELARFEQLLQQYEHQADQYMNLAKAVDPASATVPVVLGSNDHLAIATDVAKRLSDLLGRAQRNFQFAMIFEQRRTNKLLFEGFTTLADALREIPRVIEESVARVVQSTERLGTMLEGVQTRLEDVKQEIASGNSAATSREYAALAMLDNIQRRRKPGFPGRRW